MCQSKNHLKSVPKTLSDWAKDNAFNLNKNKNWLKTKSMIYIHEQNCDDPDCNSIYNDIKLSGANLGKL